MIELISVIVTIFAVAGVILNNRRRRACFVVWFVSNGMSLGVHVASGLYALSVRDAIFLVLAVEGWRLWGKK